jgi:hypothetical protein
MRAWMLRVGMVLLVGALLGALSGCGHNPNHGIDMQRAQDAADRIHPRPKPGEQMKPGHGG